MIRHSSCRRFCTLQKAHSRHTTQPNCCGYCILHISRGRLLVGLDSLLAGCLEYHPITAVTRHWKGVVGAAVSTAG
jgi:hypothetical protein